MAIPTIRTERLLLREFSSRDAPSVQALAGSREVASTTLTIPHPYEDGMADSWIKGHSAAWDDRKSLTLAIATESDGLVGAIGLHFGAETWACRTRILDWRTLLESGLRD